MSLIKQLFRLALNVEVFLFFFKLFNTMKTKETTPTGNRCELGSVVFPGRESGATRTSKDTANKVLFSVNSEHTDARLG